MKSGVTQAIDDDRRHKRMTAKVEEGVIDAESVGAQYLGEDGVNSHLLVSCGCARGS